MITVVAKCVIKADEVQKFKDISSELIAETRKEEANVSYNLYEEVNHPQVLTFIEEWKDQAALDQHIASKHFSEIFPKLQALQQQEMELSIYKKCE